MPQHASMSAASRVTRLEHRVRPIRQAADLRAPDEQPYCAARSQSEQPSQGRKRGHRGDNVQLRRCPSPHTPRCPRSFAVPPRKPARLRARSGSAFGSRYEGGATPPAAEDVDPNAVDVCPRGDVAPPSWRFAVEKRRRASAGAGCSAKGTSVSAATVTAIAPTRERTVVLSGVKVSRASRAARRLGTRDLDTASARPVNGNCRIESEPRT